MFDWNWATLLVRVSRLHRGQRVGEQRRWRWWRQTRPNEGEAGIRGTEAIQEVCSKTLRPDWDQIHWVDGGQRQWHGESEVHFVANFFIYQHGLCVWQSTVWAQKCVYCLCWFCVCLFNKWWHLKKGCICAAVKGQVKKKGYSILTIKTMKPPQPL